MSVLHKSSWHHRRPFWTKKSAKSYFNFRLSEMLKLCDLLVNFDNFSNFCGCSNLKNIKIAHIFVLPFWFKMAHYSSTTWNDNKFCSRIWGIFLVTIDKKYERITIKILDLYWFNFQHPMICSTRNLCLGNILLLYFC